MRKPTDDIASWRLQQENTSKPFPYVFPQMPPRFWRCCAFAKAVFLIQWGCFAASCVCSMVLFIPVVIRGRNMGMSAMIENRPFLAFFIVVAAISLLIFFAAVPFGFIPKLFWRCPCCGHPFPYYVPIRRNNLKEQECLRNIEGQHIKYVKLKFCPLIIPSVCPECRCKFFEMADDLQNVGKIDQEEKRDSRRRSKNMRWIDGKEINIRQFTGETLCEKLATDLWSNDYDQWLKCADFIQTASFLIAFDTELTMEGIFAFLENSIGHYAPNIIQAFRIIGDKNDADILEKICQIAPPDIMRGEFLSETQQEYDFTTFNDNHELNEEAEARIEELNKQLYLHSGIDIWSLLFTYLDEQIENL